MFLTALGTALVPARVFAQEQRVWRIGVLASQPRPASLENHPHFGTFLAAMRRLGYVEGQNVRYDWRFADGKMERLEALAAQLVKSDVIVAPITAAVLAIQKVTKTVPIVFVSVADPVGSGIASSLARPAGNATGLSMLQGQIAGKQLEILGRVVPKASRIVLLTNPANPGNRATVVELDKSARKVGLQLTELEAKVADEIEPAFRAAAKRRAQALLVAPDALFLDQRHQVTALAASFRLPAVYGLAEFVEAGGLMSYGLDLSENFRRAAVYVDKILKGAKPGDLAVEQPSKLELLLNKKVAQSLGIRFPPDVLALADRIIE
jgi:putative ABC transport system substrate-binding protein